MTLEQLGPVLGPILLIMATGASCLLAALKIIDKRTERKNGKKIDLEMIPGHSEICQERGTEITELVTNYKFVIKEITEINTNVGNLWKHAKKNGP